MERGKREEEREELKFSILASYRLDFARIRRLSRYRLIVPIVSPTERAPSDNILLGDKMHVECEFFVSDFLP